MRLLAATAFAVLAIAPALAADPVIAKVEARLFIASTGELSPNVADNSDVVLWNTIIADGEFGPATDTLVVVTVKADAGSYVEAPLTITVTTPDGKIVGSRKVEGLLVRDNGFVATPVLVPDSTCNALTIKASIGTSEMSALAAFACGE